MLWWVRQAAAWPVARRALGFALVVGAILIAINHGQAIVRGELDRGRLLQMGLTLLVLEYVGLSQSGSSPLKWWVRSHRGSAQPGARPATWPGQAVIVLGVAAIALGLLLQLLGSFS